MSDRVSHFLSETDWSNPKMLPVTGDLSSRKYTRLSQNGRTAILMECDTASDASLPAYMKMTDWLRGNGLAAPERYNAEPSEGLALIEDFGDSQLTSLIRQRPSDQLAYYKTIIETLITIRNAPFLSLKQPNAAELCDATTLADQWYPGAERCALDTFRAGLETVLRDVLDARATVSLRDFHADNIIWLSNRKPVQQPGLLDYQDAILTHPVYDLMSLLTDARTDVSASLRKDLIETYASRTSDDIASLAAAFAALGAQRNLRILGIFTQAARRYGKTQHLPALPRVYAYLMECAHHPALEPFSQELSAALPKPDAAFIKALTG